MLGAKLEDLKLKDKKLQKPMRLGHAQASLPVTLAWRVLLKAARTFSISS